MDSRLPAVRFEAVRKAFERGGAGYGVVDNVTLALPPGACLMLVGPNGCGKTTILRMACGLVTPDGGRLRVLGGDPASDGAVRARLAALFEGRALYARLSPRENAAYFAALKGQPAGPALRRFDALAERFGIAGLRQVAARKLSRGTQQKFALACALACAAELWVLDEPTLGLDGASVAVLADLVREHLAQGGALLMASHDRALARRLGTIAQVAPRAGPVSASG